MLMRRLLRASIALGVFYLGATAAAGFLLPEQLLQAPLPARSEAEREALRARLAPPGTHWTSHRISGGESAPLDLWWLHRPASKGVALILHGFGDDAWGAAPRLRDLPELDAAVFTFRGRDRHPEIPSTLGAWEGGDVAAAVRFLEAQGVSRSRIVLVGSSQGAGAALLGLARLEPQGGPLAGALLESPWKDLRDAALNHLRGPLGWAEPLARPAELLALRRAGRLGHFRAEEVSPLEASKGLRTPIALLAGDADDITPLAGVQAIAAFHPDLTIVPGAGHGEAGAKLPGGWRAWAQPRLDRWLSM